MSFRPAWLRRQPHLLWDTADVIVKRVGDEAWAVRTDTREIIARSTDHAEVVQKAVDSVPRGGKVFIRAGVYRIEREIKISSPVIIQGEGPEWFVEKGTYLKAYGCHCFNFEFPELDYMPIVQDLQISVGSGYAGIRLGKNVSDPVVERVAVHGGIGVLVDGSPNGFIRNCWLETGDYGVRIVSGGTGYMIYGNRFYNNKEASVSVENFATSQLIVAYNIFNKDRKNSIYLDLTQALVIGNVIRNASIDYPGSYDAIKVLIRGELIVANNIIYGSSTRHGVHIAGDNSNARVIIRGNTFSVGSSAIRLAPNLAGKYLITANIGYYTERSGVTTLSGDGSTTDFVVGAHGLSPSITDPGKVVVKCTPASPDAIVASPCTCYLSDEDGDGVYESIRVKFANPPASGTNNVKIVWRAEYIG